MDTPLPLPASGPERGIFLAALRSYSASCRPPQLHESCPFSTYISQGARGCGEECVAILGSHDVGPESAGIPLTGNGLAAAARPDLTSSPSERGVERAFDAAEIYYRESDHGDVAAYSAVTTIYALSQIVARPPSDRLNAGGFDALIERLAVHGFDVDAVVRHGLRASLTNAIAFTTIFSSLVDAAAAENSDAEKDEPGVSPDGPQLQSNGLSPEWPALRDTLYSGYAATGHGNVSVETEGKLVPLDSAEQNLIAFTVVGPFRKLLDVWVDTADLRDLLAWRAPTAALISIIPDERPSLSNEAKRAVWAVDRYTTTYVADWAPDSLRFEYMFQRGKCALPCRQQLAAERKIDLHALSLIVADMQVSPTRDYRRLDDLIHRAGGLLAEGRRAAAAALFKVFRGSDYDIDGQMDNNYAFCLLPDDPLQALASLESARAAGFRDTINIANRVLALHWQGRNGAAISLAEDALEAWPQLACSSSAYVWDFAKGREATELRTSECPRCYLARLASFIADSEGDTIRAGRWRSLFEAAG